MSKDYFEDSKVEMVMTFDENGMARSVFIRGEPEVRVDYSGKWPDDTFRPTVLNPDGPLKNINLLKTEVFDILVWEELGPKGDLIKKHICPHIRCRPYC